MALVAAGLGSESALQAAEGHLPRVLCSLHRLTFAHIVSAVAAYVDLQSN